MRLKQETATIMMDIVYVLNFHAAEAQVATDHETAMNEAVIIVVPSRNVHNIVCWCQDYRRVARGKISRITCVKLAMFVLLTHTRTVLALLSSCATMT